MATTKVGLVTHTWLMSNKDPRSKSTRPKTSSISHYVPAAAVTAYNAAADDAARAATLIGALIDAENALSKGVHAKVDVGFSFVDNAAIPPTVSDGAYSFDKFGVSYSAVGKNYVASIPARLMTAVVMSSDGITVDTGAGASDETNAYVSAFNAVVLSEDLVAGTILGMNVRS